MCNSQKQTWELRGFFVKRGFHISQGSKVTLKLTLTPDLTWSKEIDLHSIQLADMGPFSHHDSPLKLPSTALKLRNKCL